MEGWLECRAMIDFNAVPGRGGTGSCCPFDTRIRMSNLRATLVRHIPPLPPTPPDPCACATVISNVAISCTTTRKATRIRQMQAKIIPKSDTKPRTVNKGSAPREVVYVQNQSLNLNDSKQSLGLRASRVHHVGDEVERCFGAFFLLNDLSDDLKLFVLVTIGMHARKCWITVPPM